MEGINKARIYVDFNEMVTEDIVLLSKEDKKEDFQGKTVTFYEGKPVRIYSDDVSDQGPDRLIADGIAVRYDLSEYPYWSHVKWCCRIDEKGIYHESESRHYARTTGPEPDVEVMFRFNGTRDNPAFDGYRPSHLVKDDYLTTGLHHYYGMEQVASDGEAYGTITFISPEHYPGSLWIGKTIMFQEGARVVGQATVLEIFNPVLDRDHGR